MLRRPDISEEDRTLVSREIFRSETGFDMKPDIAALLEICQRHKLPEGVAVVAEAYIPFLPENWNGVLVVAEAQNLAKKNEGYLEWLKELPDPCRRLGSHPDGVGVAPWDDGSLKLAVEAALGVDAECCAVSNAVLWSVVDGSRNKNPDEDAIARSKLIWSEMLPVLRPKTLVTSGKVAYGVFGAAIEKAGVDAMRLDLRLPSPTAMSRISNMFDQGDLLSRFPEVQAVIDRHPAWLKGYPQNKVFFACHAVSAAKKS